MISVESIRPTTTRPVCVPRRGILRRPIRNMIRLPIQMPPTDATHMPKISTSVHMIVVIEIPNRLSIAVPSFLLTRNPAVAHADDAMAAGTDTGVVGDDDEGLLVAVVQVVQQLHDLVGGGRVQVA